MIRRPPRWNRATIPPAAAAARPPTGRSLLALAFAATLSLAAAESAGAENVFGWAERVLIEPGQLQLRAKLDTGADTSSLHAIDIRRVRRGDRSFVRFTVESFDSGERFTLERPLLRRARIKRHNGDSQKRPVVAIDVCLGGHLLRQTEVSLIDRSEFLYPLLLGRSALAGIAVVDPALTFTRAPSCEQGKADP